MGSSIQMIRFTCDEGLPPFRATRFIFTGHRREFSQRRRPQSYFELRLRRRVSTTAQTVTRLLPLLESY